MRKTMIENGNQSTRNRSERGDFFVQKPDITLNDAWLSLDDNTQFVGQAPQWQQGKKFVGEVVFNTGMTGYVESLTDPSYAGQILTFTFPLIGNYGVLSDSMWESLKIHAAGVIVSDACIEWSHTQGEKSLLSWLEEQGIPIMVGVDTRALTKYLRSRGTMLGRIQSTKPTKHAPITMVPVQVTIDAPIEYGNKNDKHVILVDCGAKTNIVRSLQAQGLHIKRVPANYDYTNEDYDGVMLSNGPGDPTDYPETITIAAKALKKGKPVFGICLGTQVMALAAGGKTYKLPYGHRGHNQPCMDLNDEHCVITSQNHGYAIDEKSLPKDWQVWFRNLNDNSVEGIQHKTKPFFSVQFHPEASPGPTDTHWIFKKFSEAL